MAKVKLILSDFHLGTGQRFKHGGINPMEDFLHDNRFKELLEYHSSGEYASTDVELIFNGDILNLIQIDYHGHYTVVITESVSVEKLRKVMRNCYEHPEEVKRKSEQAIKDAHNYTWRKSAEKAVEYLKGIKI